MEANGQSVIVTIRKVNDHPICFVQLSSLILINRRVKPNVIVQI